jgi:hypothetical protein
LVIAPIDYPNYIIGEEILGLITTRLNKGIKSRENRPTVERLRVQRVLYLSGTVILRGVSRFTAIWLQFMVQRIPADFPLATFQEENFTPAQAFTVWVPDSESDFARVMRKVTEVINISTANWRLLRVFEASPVKAPGTLESASPSSAPTLPASSLLKSRLFDSPSTCTGNKQ